MEKRSFPISPIVFVILLATVQTAYAWLDPADSETVDTVLNSKDNQFAFYNGPTGQSEWLINNGGRSTIRIKGYDDPSALQWDLSSYANKNITEAELHLCLTSGSVVNALVVSTINSAWSEGTKYGSTAGTGESCWRWRSYPDGEWTYKGSDFSTASFGNFGTLVSFGYKHSDTFKQYSAGGNSWIAMKLDPAIVYAMILDNPGLVVTDPRFGYENGNPSIYSKDQNSSVQPRLLLQTSPSTDNTAPASVTSLKATPGEWNGEVILSFTAPQDPTEEKAFGYEVRFATHNDFASASTVARWRIPRPGIPGSQDRLIIEDLTPGNSYQFWVQAYDKFGNSSSPVLTSLSLPATIPSPAFASGDFTVPDPAGKEIAGQAGVLRYWPCSELSKVNPLTGNRLVDGYTGSGDDDYKKANPIWDAATNTITLQAARNQMVSFQLIIQRLLPSLTGLSIQASDISGPSGSVIAANNMEFFKLHYTGGTVPYPDPAIPLQAPFSSTFTIPNSNNESGSHQSIWADLYVPRDAQPGSYSGTLLLAGNQLTSPISINLKLQVASPVLPDTPTFFLDLNGYGNKWSSEASRYQVFQLSHKHRMVPNTLPYGWSETWSADRAPLLSGSGANLQISDWTIFAAKYGPFFDGSAFSPSHSSYPYRGPGENTPIANFYTTGFEGWPIKISDTTYGYDTISGGKGHAYWNQLVDAGGSSLQTFWREAPDVLHAFPSGYSEGSRKIWQEFAEYAQAHNWATTFQFYLNNKRSYSGSSALWTLEEEYVADDFRADAFFMALSREGWEAADAPDTNFHWRIDTSTRWQQNWGQLKSIANLRVQGDGKFWDYRQDRYRRYTEQHPEQRWWYGTGPARTHALSMHSAEILQHWSHGFDGGTPYWDNFQNNWTTASGSAAGGDATLSLMLEGSDVPGHGYFDGRIATIRMKGMRHGQQLCELLNLLAGKSGWNRNLVSRALSSGYGNNAGVGYDSYGGDEYSGMNIVDFYRLQSDLIATLESIILPGDVDSNGYVDIRDAISALQVSTGSYRGVLQPYSDINDDGQIGLEEALYILSEESSVGH